MADQNIKLKTQDGTTYLYPVTKAANVTGLATVATSGSYNDLTNRPTITDTKNTAGSTNSTSKLFLIGATSQAANPTTNSRSTTFVAADGAVNSTAFTVNETARIQYNATAGVMEIIC